MKIMGLGSCADHAAPTWVSSRVVASKVPIAKAQLLGRLQPQLAARWKLGSYCDERTGYAGFVV